MDDFTQDDWKRWLYGPSPFSSDCTDDDVSSIFHQADTAPSAPCLGFAEWMQAEEPADTFLEFPLSRICGDLFEDNFQLQLNCTDESALLSHDLSQPTASRAFLEYMPQVAAVNATSSLNGTSDPQKVACSSTSITNAYLPDLNNIIIKKPILDKAVERLGGGKNGAQRLWGLIQLWLKLRNVSTSFELPFMSNNATNQEVAALPTCLEKKPFHESNTHGEIAASFEMIGPAMNASPTSAPITIPGESIVLGPNATAAALAAYDSPTCGSHRLNLVSPQPPLELDVGGVTNMRESRARSSSIAATSRAARKYRMDCKRRYLSHYQARSAALSPKLGSATFQDSGACHDSYQPGVYSFFHYSKEIGSKKLP